MHAVRRALVTAQAEAAGLPLYGIDLPWPCSNEVYESRMADAWAVSKRTASLLAFGDLFLGLRRYREERLAGTSLKPLFPLWKTKSTWDLADEMLEGSSRLPDVCRSTGPGSGIRRPPVRPRPALRPARKRRPVRRERRVPLVRVGRSMFSHPVAVEVGERVTRDGFVFADVVPVAVTSSQ